MRIINPIKDEKTLTNVLQTYTFNDRQKVVKLGAVNDYVITLKVKHENSINELIKEIHNLEEKNKILEEEKIKSEEYIDIKEHLDLRLNMIETEFKQFNKDLLRDGLIFKDKEFNSLKQELEEKDKKINSLNNKLLKLEKELEEKDRSFKLLNDEFTLALNELHATEDALGKKVIDYDNLSKSTEIKIHVLEEEKELAQKRINILEEDIKKYEKSVSDIAKMYIDEQKEKSNTIFTAQKGLMSINEDINSLILVLENLILEEKEEINKNEDEEKIEDKDDFRLA